MNFKQHLKELSSLAWPLIISQIGHIVTGIVDTIFLGKLGPMSTTAQAAGILANQLFVVLLVFGIGVSYSLTPKITQADEQQDGAKKASLLKSALIVNLSVALCLFVILYFSSSLLGMMQQEPDVVELAKPFFNVLIFSIIPLALYFVGKQYMEGLSNTKIAMIISIAGNLINIVLNYCFIFGKMGSPEMGYMGSCWATFIARCCMGFGFIIVLFYYQKNKDLRQYFPRVNINWPEVKNLLFSGIASGLQFAFEITAFMVAALMVGSISKEQLVAHGIVMHLISLTYMFASGIGGAAMIRAGSFFAKKEYRELRLANRVSFLLVCGVMGMMSLIFILFNHHFASGFSANQTVIETTSVLLIIAGIFQLFDGIQVTAISILRGLEDFKVPTVIALLAYWVLAIPLAYFLAFKLGYGAYGIWCSLCVSLMFIACCLYLRIQLLQRKMNQ